MNTNAKGNRNQNELVKLLNSKGYSTITATRKTIFIKGRYLSLPNDFFSWKDEVTGKRIGGFDICAKIQKGVPIEDRTFFGLLSWIQVKSTKPAFNKAVKETSEFCEKHVSCPGEMHCVALRKDGGDWLFWRYPGETMEMTR